MEDVIQHAYHDRELNDVRDTTATRKIQTTMAPLRHHLSSQCVPKSHTPSVQIRYFHEESQMEGHIRQ